MTYHQPYLENPLKMNSINLPTSEMIRNVTNTRPTSDPSFNNILKPMVLQQQNNPYVKSMLYENRENTYSDIINTKSMTTNSLYMNGQYKSSEAEAIDKMFEDLSNYEKTLEEMANAKLDDEFKEELAAIEQWFTVLSECERTTVLYSLIQNISELQVRFFLTLLQQKVKSNPLFNSMIKKPVTDSIYSSSTKHCSNTSSDNSSMINSTSADTYYDDDDYQKNSFVDSNNLQNKSNSNQFSCPLNMNEYNMAVSSLSNANLLNERTSSLSRPMKQNHTHSQQQHQHQPSQSSTSSQSPANSRKNSYMNTIMNDYSNSAANLSVLGNMNTVLMNGINNNQATNQFLSPPSQTNIMVNNNATLYSSDNQRMANFTNNSTNNLQMLNQNAINSLMNPNSLSLLNSSNTTSTANSTSALPVLSPTTTPLTLYKSNSNQTSPMISPIRPPKSSNKMTNGMTTTTTATTINVSANDNTNQHQYHQHQQQQQQHQQQQHHHHPKNTNTNETNTKELLSSKIDNEKENSKAKANAKSLTEILLNSKESKEGSKNASILSDILTLSKEMNDMVIKNRERAKKEKLAKAAASAPTTPTTPTPSKKTLSDDGEGVPHSGESVVNASPKCEKGKIPDQINLEMLEDIPSFLRSLRLHKYSPAFEGLNWKQMIKLENDELLKRGVTALGARNKMLKVFDLIRAEAVKQGVSLDC